jgi:hypothetical protein
MSGNVPALVRWLVRAKVIPKAAVAQLDGVEAPEPQAVLDAGRLAEQTYDLLDQLGQDVVLIARMGQNLAQFKLTYSHLGFAYKGDSGEWQVLHLLNKEDASTSGIFEEGIANFYSDNLFRFEACVLTLPRALQKTLLEAIKTHRKTLHCAYYSLTSHPDSLGTQNSNQWVLEVLASGLAQMTAPTRMLVQQWLRENGYVCSTLKIPLATQWAGPLLRDSIRFGDQPDADRRQELIRTITVDSVVDWLQGEASPLGPGRAECRLHKLSL